MNFEEKENEAKQAINEDESSKIKENVNEKDEEKQEEIKENLDDIEDNKEKDNEKKDMDEKDQQIKESQGLILKQKKEIEKIKDQNYKLSNQLNALKDRLKSITTEYDNYRSRTSKEKEGIYTDACADVLKNVFPIIDNLERAVSIEGSTDDIKKGVEMTLKQFDQSLSKLGVEEISTDGKFDPNLHNAVMHVEDENYEEKQIVEVFQKGYKKDDKVLRYSMVKVAN